MCLTHWSELSHKTLTTPVRTVDMLQRYVRKTQTIVVSQRDIQVVYQHHVRILHTHTQRDIFTHTHTDTQVFRYMSSSVCLSSVCLSVMFVHPTEAFEIFRNVSTPFGTLAIWLHLCKILRRSSQGNPFIGGVKHKGGSRI